MIKITMRSDSIIVKEPTEEFTQKAKDLPSSFHVSFTDKGDLRIQAHPTTLYIFLYGLAKEYDLEIV